MKIYTVSILNCLFCPSCEVRSGFEYCVETGDRIKWDVFPEDCPLPDLEESQCK